MPGTGPAREDLFFEERLEDFEERLGVVGVRDADSGSGFWVDIVFILFCGLCQL